jgi:WD40 repeat protein
MILETKNGQLHKEFKGNWWNGNLAWFPDVPMLIAFTSDERCVTLNVETGEQGTVFKRAAPENIYSLALSPDGRLLAVGFFQGTIQVWDIASKTLHRTLQGYHMAVLDLVWSRDGGTLVEASNDGSIRLWDVANRRVRTLLREQPGSVYCAALSRDGRLLVSGHSN